MKLKYADRSSRRNLVAGFLSLVLFATPLLAGGRYLEPEQVDGIALLPAPPAPDSAEQVVDLNSVRAVFKGRTPAEQAHAEKSATLSIYNFASVIGDHFKKGRYPKLEALMETVKTNISQVINTPKDHWKRTRPYVIDPELSLGKPETSFSYPSGHSTRGTMQSLILAEVFPEQRQAILENGRAIGWDRVIIGKHYPTDVNAGRVLGQAIFRELMKSPDFQRDLAAAKAEVSALRVEKN